MHEDQIRSEVREYDTRAAQRGSDGLGHDGVWGASRYDTDTLDQAPAARTELQIDRPGKATGLLGQERCAGLFAVAGAVGASRAGDAEGKCAGGRGVDVPRKSRERPACAARRPVPLGIAQYR